MQYQFSWLSFLKARGVHYVEHGANVAPNHVNVRCPFCLDDPSQHMGLSLDPKHPYYACWRNTSHRGKNPVRVIAALLKIGYNEAEQIVRVSNQVFSDDLTEELRVLIEEPKTIIARETNLQAIQFDKAIRPLDHGPFTDHFYGYLEKRGFPDPERVARKYDLHYAISGKWAWRLIFPIRVFDKLVSYVGRDISGRSSFRYKNLPNKLSALPMRDCLMFEDSLLEGGQALYVAEGPLDALKLAAYLPSGHKATCCFGIPSHKQIHKLSKLASKFRKVILALDSEMATQMVSLVEELSAFCTVVKAPRLPPGVKDPGDFTPKQVILFSINGLTRARAGAI